MLAFEQLFTIIVCVLACTICFILGLAEGEKYLARLVKSSPYPGKLRVGTYYPSLDLVCLNPEALRKIPFRSYIESAIHEFYHAHNHRFGDESLDPTAIEAFEKEAYEWSGQMMALLSEKLDWAELEKYVGLMRGYEVREEFSAPKD